MPIFLWFALVSNQILMYSCLGPPYSLTYMAIKFHFISSATFGFPTSLRSYTELWIHSYWFPLAYIIMPCRMSSQAFNSCLEIMYTYSGVFLLGKVHILAHIFCHVSYRLLVNNCSIVEVLIFPTAVVDLACHLLSDQLIYISHAILHHAHLHAS